jgi:predicted secreted protein
MWDETDTTDNQTGEQATFARKGSAYLNDATFNFNDRENATKSLQFTGSGALETISSTPSYEAVSASAYTKGQFVRLFMSSDNTTAPAKVIAAAKTLSLHVSMQMEDASSKDTPGSFQIQEPTGLSYDISTSALVRGNDTITSAVAAQDLASIESIYEAGTPVKWKICNVSGANQRTAGAVIASGSVLLTQLTLNGPNRQNATYDAQLTGYGAYTVGA